MADDDFQERLARYRSEGHTNTCMSIVRVVAVLAKAETGEPIPSEVLLVGEDHIFYGKVSYLDDTDVFRNSAVQVGVMASRFSLAPVVDAAIMRYRLPNEFALIPETQERMVEARELGDILSEGVHHFELRRDQYRIKVYSVRDFEHIQRDGDGFGIATFL